MNVKEFAEKLDLKVLVEGDTEREITGCYIGDLLSWVMGRAPEDSAWLTVMGNINSIAVATLADVSEVNILLSKENSYHLAVKLHELLS